MSGHRIAAITRRLLQGFRRDRRTLALLFVAPIIILGLLGYLMRGSTSAPEVGVANQDQGPLGAIVADGLKSSSHIRATEINAADGDARLRDGSLVAYVVLPSDFSQQAQAGTVAPVVHLIRALVFNLRSVPPTGEVLRPLASSEDDPARPREDPMRSDLLKVRPRTWGLFGKYVVSFVGLVVFFLVFVITIVSFLNERSQGTLERLMASPLRRGEIVVGYMLGFTVLALVQAAEVLVFALAILRIHNEGSVLLRGQPVHDFDDLCEVIFDQLEEDHGSWRGRVSEATVAAFQRRLDAARYRVRQCGPPVVGRVLAVS